MATVSIPDVGVDMAGNIAGAMELLGAIVAAVLGVWFAFGLVRSALDWMSAVDGDYHQAASSEVGDRESQRALDEGR